MERRAAHRSTRCAGGLENGFYPAKARVVGQRIVSHQIEIMMNRRHLAWSDVFARVVVNGRTQHPHFAFHVDHPVEGRARGFHQQPQIRLGLDMGLDLGEARVHSAQPRLQAAQPRLNATQPGLDAAQSRLDSAQPRIHAADRFNQTRQCRFDVHRSL